MVAKLRGLWLVLLVVACEGPRGPTGPAGEVPSREEGNAEQVREPCAWCAAFARSCTPDGTGIQRCEPDGDDGCGHWELEEACPGVCGRAANERDDLGNSKTTSAVCLPKPSPARDAGADAGADAGRRDCRSASVCTAAYACNQDSGACEARPVAGSAAAKLDNQWDKVVHEFSAATVSASGSCDGSSQTYWSTGKAWTCSVQVLAGGWSESSADGGVTGVYHGAPVRQFRVSINSVVGTGNATSPTCVLELDADRFTVLPMTSCLVTLRTATLKPGGDIEGSFSSTTKLQHMFETTAASSINVLGSFRWKIPE